MKSKYYLIFFERRSYLKPFLILALLSCLKNDWLNAKPDKALVIPSTVSDYQAILDNTNDLFSINEPGLGEVSSDDYYMLYERWQTRPPLEQNTYLWADDIFAGGTINVDWNYAYNRILNANVILEGIDKIAPDASSTTAWRNVKGSALFFRSFAYYNLAQLFCKPYEISSADEDLGLPLRISSDINIKISRASVQNTYDLIINDLLLAKELLPFSPLYKTRPSKSAVYGLLARIYLSMKDYDNAFTYTDSFLRLNNELIDFNTLDINATFPIATFNKEVTFHCTLLSYACLPQRFGIVDSLLYNSFDSNDLRKRIFFRNAPAAVQFRGSYNGTITPPFCGIATDEMYLIRAECNARKNNFVNAMADLNTLLESRWKTGTYAAQTANDETTALNIILQERRKELILRGLRWSDLRRLNTDDRFKVTLTRILNGQIFTLPPGDPKYIFPLPPDEILLGGLEQNPR